MTWRWKPGDAILYRWDRFLAWAHERGIVEALREEDHAAWWHCWKAGYRAGRADRGEVWPGSGPEIARAPS